MLLVASWPEKEVELCKMLPSNVTFSHWLSCLDRCWCGCRGFLARLWRPRRKHISDEGSTREELRKKPSPSPSPVQFLWFVKSKTRLDVTATVTGYFEAFSERHTTHILFHFTASCWASLMRYELPLNWTALDDRMFAARNQISRPVQVFSF